MENKQSMSGETWQRIDDLAWRIRGRKIWKRDRQAAKDADLINALLKVLSFAILLGASLGTFGVVQPLAEKQPGPKTTSRKDTSSAPRQMVIAKGVTVTYPENWGPSTIRYNGAQHLVTPPPDGKRGPKTLFAQMIITTESRLDHEAAVRRLSEIGYGVKTEKTFLPICGWPALQRRYLAPYPHRQDDRDGKSETGDKMTVWQTTAVAVGTLLVRLETTLAPGADEELATQAEQVGRSAVCHSATPSRTTRDLSELRTGKYVRAIFPPSRPDAEGTKPQEKRQVVMSEPGPARDATVSLGRGGELEIGASSDGLQELIASNDAVSFSNDGGATFTSTPLRALLATSLGDPSVARAKRTYLATLDDPMSLATPRACMVTVLSSTNGGASFSGTGTAASCPFISANACFPDQEHIAAAPNRFFFRRPLSRADDVYAVFRLFEGGSVFCFDAGVGPSTPEISCSTNSGATFGTAQVIGQGEHPRITVGGDGFVYVLYLDNSSLMLQKFTACSSFSGFKSVPGFPFNVTNLNLPRCPVAGLDRCDPLQLASPTLAVDDTTAQHLYISFAQQSPGGTGEDIVGMDSFDGGLTWNSGTVLSSSKSARRFMPWSCSMGGTAFVSWYDRRGAGTGSAATDSNDLTDFFLGGGFQGLGNSLATIPETQLTTVSDPQCTLWGPGITAIKGSGPRSINDSESCSVQPQNAGSCMGASIATSSGTACDFSSSVCPSGESCTIGQGIPKYGDYNGIACAGGKVFTAWASATPASLSLSTGTRGIAIFNKTITLSPPQLAIRIDLTPVSSSARFILSLDGNVVASGVGDTTIQVPGLMPRNYTVSVAAVPPANVSGFNVVFAGDCSAAGTIGVFAGNNKTCEIEISSHTYVACQNKCGLGMQNCMAHVHDSSDIGECRSDARTCIRSCR